VTNVFPARGTQITSSATILDTDTNTIFVMSNVNMTITLPHCKNGSTTYDGKRLTFLIPGGTATQTFAKASGSTDQVADIYGSVPTGNSYTYAYSNYSMICTNVSGSGVWYVAYGGW
jgi:hypothetical protein